MTTMTIMPAHRRHDISDRVWNILAPLLPGRNGKSYLLALLTDCGLRYSLCYH